MFATQYMYEKLTKCQNFTQYLPEKIFSGILGQWQMSPLFPICYAYAIYLRFAFIYNDRHTILHKNGWYKARLPISGTIGLSTHDHKPLVDLYKFLLMKLIF